MAVTLRQVSKVQPGGGAGEVTGLSFVGERTSGAQCLRRLSGLRSVRWPHDWGQRGWTRRRAWHRPPATLRRWRMAKRRLLEASGKRADGAAWRARCSLHGAGQRHADDPLHPLLRRNWAGASYRCRWRARIGFAMTRRSKAGAQTVQRNMNSALARKTKAQISRLRRHGPGTTSFLAPTRPRPWQRRFS